MKRVLVSPDQQFSRQDLTTIPLHSETEAKQQVPSSQNALGSLKAHRPNNIT